jgi:hypothetical protein
LAGAADRPVRDPVGTYDGAFDIFEITIEGRGGHAAMLHLVVDPVVAQIASRNTHPLESAVVSVTQIHGGDTWNVLPETVARCRANSISRRGLFWVFLVNTRRVTTRRPVAVT